MSEGVLGQGEEFTRLLEEARDLRLHHGLLLEGAPGTGKTTAAHALALALLEGRSASAATRKQVAARQHPDLHWLAPPKDRVDIPVDAVRELQAALAQHAFAARARVAILDPADRLNEQGQNALLKTLEEPGEAVYLLLVTNRPEGLLGTVHSRVARYRMRPLQPAALDRALAARRPQSDAAVRAWAAALAEGSLGLAQDLVDDPAARELHPRLVDFLAGRGDPHELVAACTAGVSGREANEARAALVLRLLRAALRASLGGDDAQLDSELVFAGAAPYRAGALDRWIESCERVFEAENDVRLHIGLDQVLLGLFLELDARR